MTDIDALVKEIRGNAMWRDNAVAALMNQAADAITSLQIAVDRAFPNRDELRHLVDVVWSEAHEDQSVPSTDWADRMIDYAFGSRSQIAKTREERAAEWPVKDDGSYAK